MADTFTGKLLLRKPDTASNYDVGVVNSNNQIIDDNIGIVICTSSTRPSSPYNGQQIYETDTKFIYERVAGAWVQVFGYFTPIASAAARPTVGIYNGYPIWRTDKKWLEVYDGTAWRTDHYLVVGALADITSPITGQVALLTSDSKEYRWNGSAWLLQTGLAAVNVQNTDGTTTSGVYTATLTGATTASLTFIATASGKVIIHNNANCKNSGSSPSLCTIEVRAGAVVGSGTVVLAAGNEDAVFSSSEISSGRTTMITGLTAGSTYNVRQLFAVVGGTGTFGKRNLIAQLVN